MLDTVRSFGYKRLFSTIGLENKMSSESESPAGALLWQQARTDYETTTTDLNAIAEALAAMLGEDRRLTARVLHRDLGRE